MLSVISENLQLARYAADFSSCTEKAQIEELVELLKDHPAPFADCVKLYKSVFDSSLLSFRFISFCRLYDRVFSTDTPDVTALTPRGTVACLYNDYSEAALSKLKNFTTQVDQESDFNSVCEAVHSKRCRYGLIPLYNTRDGLMVSLYRLIQKYDLHIAASAKVIMGDGNTETEFFLVSSELSFYAEKEKILFLSVTHAYDSTLADLISAMARSDAQLRYVNSLPLEYTDDRCESILVFDVTDISEGALRLFTDSALPHAAVIGIYSIVK